MKKILSFLLVLALIFGMYIPRITYAENSHYAKDAKEVINLITSLKDGESITINVDSDMDFIYIDLQLTGNESVTINNISGKELYFTNISIYGTKGSNIYFGEGINIYSDSDKLPFPFLIQGDSGYGGLKVVINGDIISNYSSESFNNILYVRTGAEVIVNGDIIGNGKNSGVLAYGYTRIPQGDKSILNRTKVTINGDIKFENESDDIFKGACALDVSNGAEVVVNGNVAGGKGYYGGNGVFAYSKSEEFKSLVTINGNIYGGDGIDSTGIYSPEEVGYTESYGYALYANKNSSIKYSGIIKGGKLGNNNVQKNCYEGGDMFYDTASSEDGGEVISGEYLYIGSDYDNVSYRTHVQDYGWQEYVSNGEVSGTSGESKRLEGIDVSLKNTRYSGGIEYKTHVQDYGWQEWVSNGKMSGTSGESKRLEAIEIRLTGEMSEKYDIYYRVHAQDYGWLGWTKNGEASGTEGLSKRLEAIEIRLVEKGGEAPGSIENSFIKEQTALKYKTHVQNYGWQNWVYDGELSGTSGESLRLEGLEINLESNLYNGNIEYRTHVQDYGWQGWASNGKMSGTSGESKRLEAMEIKLTGEISEKYDIYYRVHVQDYGWLGWAKNGESAGTEGLSKRLEAVEIKLVKKGEQILGSTENSFIKM